MLSLKGILILLLCLYFIGLVVVLQNGRLMRELPEDIPEQDLVDFLMDDAKNNDNIHNAMDPFPGHTYEFIDKDLAYKVLSQLDVYKPMDEAELAFFRLPSYFNETQFGFKPEDDYCDRQRAYFVEYPEFVFQEMNIVLGRFNDSWVTVNAINGFANNIHPHNNVNFPKYFRDKSLVPLKVYVNCFFTIPHLYDRLRFGKHYSCLSQISNHIPGSGHLYRKDLVAEAAIEYLKKYQDRPQCINSNKFFPETWCLAKKNECLEFFRRFNSEEYKQLQQERRIVYIKKIAGLHKGEGVMPVTPEEEVLVREQYKNGSECGKIKDNVLMQHYVYNPLLLSGRKFDFRMYMLVASTDPLIVYYHDGNLRVSLGNYTAETDDKSTHLTNIFLNKDIYDAVGKGALYEGMSLDALAYHQQWSFDRLQEHLLQAKIIDDPNWLDNYLRPEFKKAFVHLTRMTFKDNLYLETSKIYELYGVDFMLDENLNLWFIEANSGPAIQGLPDYLVKFIVTMLHDHFKIQYGLFRSRIKRVIQYVNDLIMEDGAIIQNPDGNITIPNLEKRIQEFESVNRNSFEKEFEVSPDNTWYKIVDESLDGVEKYHGWITEECL